MRRGWFGESYRHYLAGKGLRTVAANPMRPVDTAQPVLGWIAERKWDGSRLIAEVDGGRVTMRNRRGVVKDAVFPELQEMRKEVKGQALLDGEVVVLQDGKDDFKALAEREHLKDAEKIAALRRTTPVRYVVFDIVQKNGRCLRELPLRERKRLLRKTVDGTGFVRHATTTTVGEAKRAGAEGIVYKDPESPYVLGRSKAWRKYKFRNEADVAILGYEPGKGKRKGVIGALRIGVYDARGKRYRPVGKVGTGFTEEMLRELTPKVKAAQRPLVARVRYLKVGSQGALREPSFIALRQDIRPEATHL